MNISPQLLTDLTPPRLTLHTPKMGKWICKESACPKAWVLHLRRTPGVRGASGAKREELLGSHSPPHPRPQGGAIGPGPALSQWRPRRTPGRPVLQGHP